MEGVTRRSQRSHKASRMDMSSPSSDHDKSMNAGEKKTVKRQAKEKDEMSLEKEKTRSVEKKRNISSASLESHAEQEQYQKGRPQRLRKFTEKAEEELKSKQKKAKTNNGKLKVQKIKQNDEQMTMEHTEESSPEEKQNPQNQNNHENMTEETNEIKDENTQNDNEMENEQVDHVKQKPKKRKGRKAGKSDEQDENEDEKEQEQEKEENDVLSNSKKEKENQTEMEIESIHNKKDEEKYHNEVGKSTDIEELELAQPQLSDNEQNIAENEQSRKEEKVSAKHNKLAHKNAKINKARIQSEEQAEEVEDYIGEVDQDAADQEEEVEDPNNEDELSGQDNLENPQRQTHNSKARKMPWSEEEDKLVIKLVEQHGPMKWTFIAQHIPGRIGKQCRERWHNHLNPKIKKSAWSDEEEWLLFLCHKLKGNRWAEITLCMTGRTDNAIKNYWNSSMKKRLPQLCQRYSLLRKGIQVKYTVSELYQELEKDCLTQLLAMPEDKSDQIYHNLLIQEQKEKNQAVQSQIKYNEACEQSLLRQAQAGSAANASQKHKGNSKSHDKTNKTNQPSGDSSILSTAAVPNQSSQPNLVERTPVANSNNRMAYNSSEEQPNTAACTGDVKDILQRIPQSPVQFDEFKKQILLYSSHEDSQNFSSLKLKEQSPSENKNEDHITNLPESQKQQRSQESPSVDISWSDTKNLERMLSTPMSVQKYVQNNPQFADIIRTALKFPSNNQEPLKKQTQPKKQKHPKSAKSVASQQQLDQSENKEGTQLPQGQEVQEKQAELELEVTKQSKVNEKKVTKKRAPKKQLVNDENSNSGINKSQQQPQSDNQTQKSANNPKSSSREPKPSSKNPKKSQQLLLPHGNLPYYHPMYMMNHPFYNPHPGQYPGYPNPLSPSNNNNSSSSPSTTTGNTHPHSLPSHHLLNPHMFQPHYFRHPPQHNPSSALISKQQSQQELQNGHKKKRPSHHPHPNQQQQQQAHPSSSLHQIQFNSELQEIQEHNYQTPMKYQKNNSSQRVALRQQSNIPSTQQQQQQSPLRDGSSRKNNLSYNPSEQLHFSDELKNHKLNTPFELQNNNTNSFLKENIHPNRGALISSSQHHNHNNSSERPHNLHYFTTPNKYETPSKLLDFDSDVHLNCGSIDHYFNMGVFSSHKKINHTVNSAFKGFPTTPNNHHIHKSPF